MIIAKDKDNGGPSPEYRDYLFSGELFLEQIQSPNVNDVTIVIHQ